MSYKHDIFISYIRDPQTDHWYQEVAEKLRLWVGLELGVDPIIWLDKRDIELGAKAPSEIQTALKHSRCLVAFWSPHYFRSQWCMTEWQTFTHRSEKYSRNLILPASVYDGDSFPPAARDTQYQKFNEYFTFVKTFWDAPSALQFGHDLKAFAKRLADMLLEAPEFEDFEFIEAKEADLQPKPRIGRIADV